MDLAYVRELYSYNRWANNSFLAVVERLKPEQFERKMGSSFSSVHDTVVHILGAEWIWLERWNGRSPRQLPIAEDLPDPATIVARWKQVEDERSLFLSHLAQADLAKSVTYVNQKGETWTYPLWQLLAHVANHSTYHRGQLATLLRQLGEKPTMTDFLFYYDQQAVR